MPPSLLSDTNSRQRDQAAPLVPATTQPDSTQRLLTKTTLNAATITGAATAVSTSRSYARYTSSVDHNHRQASLSRQRRPSGPRLIIAQVGPEIYPTHQTDGSTSGPSSTQAGDRRSTLSIAQMTAPPVRAARLYTSSL